MHIIDIATKKSSVVLSSQQAQLRLQKLGKNAVKVGYLRILEALCRHLKITIKIRSKTFWGGHMLVVIPEAISLCLYRHGFYEEGLTQMILKFLQPGMTFFDIGAHYGYFTLLASFIVGDKGKVYSFEPTPSTFGVLKDNVCKVNNVIVNNCAVLSKEKKVLMHDYGVRYSAFNSIYAARLPHGMISDYYVATLTVSAVPLDDYVRDNSTAPDFIKIDAESSEYEILLGMEKTIERFHPIISIEVGDMNVHGVPTSRGLIDFLMTKGYAAYEYKDGKVAEHVPHNGVYEYDNMVFLPR